MKPLIVDTLASGKGSRISTRDVIGAGPRSVAGVFETFNWNPVVVPVERYLSRSFSVDDFDVLLVSGMSSDISAMIKTVRKWRKLNNGGVLVGGPACSEPERVLRRTGADIAVVGEGEETLAELLEKRLIGSEDVDLDEIRGIGFRDKKKITVNSRRPLSDRDIFDRYRSSTRVITAYDLYKASRVYVEAVRGCSNYYRARVGPIGDTCTYCEQCTEAGLEERYDCPVGIPPGCGYCSVPTLFGPPRSKKVEIIIEEVKDLLDLGIHRFVLSAPGFLDYGRDLIVDPEPLTDPRFPEANYEIVEKLLSNLSNLPQIIDGDASLMIENIKASLVTERAASILGKYLRDTPVSIGFETGSEEHGKVLGRPDTPVETLEALKRLKKAGMKPYVYFIHGLPGQTRGSALESVEMIRKSMVQGAERVILYRFMSLPLSSFEACSSAAPAIQDPNSKLIYDASLEANLESKKELVGQDLKVVVANRYDKDRRFYVTYPMLHGPVVLVKGEYSSGDVLNVKISGIASERIVYAEILGD